KHGVLTVLHHVTCKLALGRERHGRDVDAEGLVVGLEVREAVLEGLGQGIGPGEGDERVYDRRGLGQELDEEIAVPAASTGSVRPSANVGSGISNGAAASPEPSAFNGSCTSFRARPLIPRPPFISLNTLVMRLCLPAEPAVFSESFWESARVSS